MKTTTSYRLTSTLALAPLLALPTFSWAATVANPTPLPQCMDNTAFFDPTLPPSINLPRGSRRRYSPRV